MMEDGDGAYEYALTRLKVSHDLAEPVRPTPRDASAG